MARQASIQRGDVYWVVDDSRGVPGIAHPYVVLQDNVFNQSRVPTVIVCALTTNLQRAHEPGNLLLDEGEANLPKRSAVVVSHLCVFDKTQLGERIGAVSDARVEQVLSGLRFQQNAFFRD